MATVTLSPSQRVRVIQKLTTREGPWKTEIIGRVVSHSASPTGSWYAHGKNGRLWLHRLRLEKDDGEIVDLIIDDDSEVTVLEGE